MNQVKNDFLFVFVGYKLLALCSCHKMKFSPHSEGVCVVSTVYYMYGI